VPDIVRGLSEFGLSPLVHDPIADPQRTEHEYGLRLSPWESLGEVDALVLAVPHQEYLARPLHELLAPLASGGVVADVKSALDPTGLPPALSYWSL